MPNSVQFAYLYDEEPAGHYYKPGLWNQTTPGPFSSFSHSLWPLLSLTVKPGDEIKYWKVASQCLLKKGGWHWREGRWCWQLPVVSFPLPRLLFVERWAQWGWKWGWGRRQLALVSRDLCTRHGTPSSTEIAFFCILVFLYSPDYSGIHSVDQANCPLPALANDYRSYRR